MVRIELDRTVLVTLFQKILAAIQLDGQLCLVGVVRMVIRIAEANQLAVDFPHLVDVVQLKYEPHDLCCFLCCLMVRRIIRSSHVCGEGLKRVKVVSHRKKAYTHMLPCHSETDSVRSSTWRDTAGDDVATRGDSIRASKFKYRRKCIFFKVYQHTWLLKNHISLNPYPITLK